MSVPQPVKRDIVIYQGATYLDKFVWKVKNKAVKTPVDLTGATARMHIRQNQKSETILVELTTENGRIVLGGVEGTIELQIEDDATDTFTWTSGVYDLEIKFADGFVRRLMQGNVAVSPSVTREV